MSLRDYITASIATTPAKLQWVYDPCRLAHDPAESEEATLAVGAKSYHILIAHPHLMLRFRQSYETLRAKKAHVLVISPDTPLAIADIMATCLGSKRGNFIDCSPKAILESPPPLGTGVAWHDLVNDLSDEFPALLDGLVGLTSRHGGKLNPNTRTDAIRLVVAAKLQDHTDTRTLSRMLIGRLASADLYALALRWEDNNPGAPLRPLWKESCEHQQALPGRVSEQLSDLERAAWLTALKSPEARDQLRNFLWTTLALARYETSVAALRPGVIGRQADETWTERTRWSPKDVCDFLAELKKKHTRLFQSLTVEYDRWLRDHPSIRRQLLVALELAPEGLAGASPSLDRARLWRRRRTRSLPCFWQHCV